MELVEVKSSNIARVGYDPDSLTMGVQFLGGNIYHYLDVPPEVHVAMMATESKGKFFAANIKPRFKCKKVDAQTDAAKPDKPAVEKMPINAAIPKQEATSAPEILLPAGALAISFEAAPGAVGFPSLPFEQMVANLRERTDEYCAPVLSQITQLSTDALALTVTDAASYEAAAIKGSQLANQRRLIAETLKAPKQSIDKVKQVFLTKEHEMLGVIEAGETHLANACTEWRRAEKQRADLAAKAEQERRVKEAEDARLRQAQMAQDAGRTGLAEKLTSTPVTAPKVEVKAEIPKTSAKGKTVYKHRVVDQSKIPDIWWILDEKALAAHARTKKYADGTVIDGIEFYQDEDTNF